MKSFMPKSDQVARSWRLMDATGRPVGRIAVEIADALRGKDRPTFTPHVDTGDFVVVVNAASVVLTGNKEDDKIYSHYSGYRSGLKRKTAAKVREQHPDRIIVAAVKGMLPKNTLARQMLKRLRVYAGPEHKHEAQFAAQQASA